ncbi:hypothetical protein CSUI_007317, partial [Cystoisospora suis]
LRSDVRSNVSLPAAASSSSFLQASQQTKGEGGGRGPPASSSDLAKDRQIKSTSGDLSGDPPSAGVLATSSPLGGEKKEEKDREEADGANRNRSERMTPEKEIEGVRGRSSER